MKPAQNDLDCRRPVWSALSDLFLDTDTDLMTDGIVRTLAQSPYSMDELERIMAEEVYPACHKNMWSVAGEWSGFDIAWLERRILEGPALLSRVCAALFAKASMRSSSQWKEIREGVHISRKNVKAGE